MEGRTVGGQTDKKILKHEASLAAEPVSIPQLNGGDNVMQLRAKNFFAAPC